jgi:hypothetical protein
MEKLLQHGRVVCEKLVLRRRVLGIGWIVMAVAQQSFFMFFPVGRDVPVPLMLTYLRRGDQNL